MQKSEFTVTERAGGHKRLQRVIEEFEKSKASGDTKPTQADTGQAAAAAK